MRLILLVPFCICAMLARTQNRSMSISELWKLYASSSNDAVKVNTLRHLATQYTRVHPDTAVVLATSAVENAQKHHFTVLEAHAYTSLGEAYDLSGEIAFYFCAVFYVMRKKNLI